MYSVNPAKRLNKIIINNPRKLRFSLLEGFFWITCASYYPFIVVYLRSLSCSNTVIGTILAVNALVSIFAQPFWGMISDKLQSVKKVFIICLGAAAVLLLTIPLHSSIFFIGFTLGSITFFESALVPLLDSWVMKCVNIDKSISYGSIRLWGSAGYATMACIFGAVIDNTSPTIIFPVYMMLALVTMMLCNKIQIETPIKKTTFNLKDIKKLISNYYFVTFLIFSCVIFIPHKAAASFLPNTIELVGGNKQQYGIAIAVMAYSEIPVFIFSKYLIKRFKPYQLIVASTIFFIIRQLLYCFITTPTFVILLQLIQGPSFGLFLVGCVYYIDSFAAKELKSTAQALTTCVYSGLSGIIGNYGGGRIIDHFGLMNLYHIGLYITIGISVLFLLSFPLGNLIFKNKC